MPGYVLPVRSENDHTHRPRSYGIGEGAVHKLYGLLLHDGQIAVADLDKEDGSFHDDNMGVLSLFDC